MADKRRFDLFADLLVARYPAARRVYDVAGGMGRLNQALTSRGREVTTFDVRHKHLPVTFAEREFTLDEPNACDLVVGLHCDGATRVIIEYAAKHAVPFAVVPCCSDNSMSYNPWMKHLHELARSLGAQTEELVLPMEGRARVIVTV
jgi:SAM-dependent methyltransferase